MRNKFLFNRYGFVLTIGKVLFLILLSSVIEGCSTKELNDQPDASPNSVNLANSSLMTKSAEDSSLVKKSQEQAGPLILDMYPKSCATDVDTLSDITITFSKRLDASSIKPEVMKLYLVPDAKEKEKDITNYVSFPVVDGKLSCSGTAITFKPSTRLLERKMYVVDVRMDYIKDADGNSLENNYIPTFWFFYTLK